MPYRLVKFLQRHTPPQRRFCYHHWIYSVVGLSWRGQSRLISGGRWSQVTCSWHCGSELEFGRNSSVCLQSCSVRITRQSFSHRYPSFMKLLLRLLRLTYDSKRVCACANTHNSVCSFTNVLVDLKEYIVYGGGKRASATSEGRSRHLVMLDAIHCWWSGTIWWTSFFHLAGYWVDDFAVDDEPVVFWFPGDDVGHVRPVEAARCVQSEVYNTSTYSVTTP